MLQAAPQQIARWKRSSARSGANYALALTKAHFRRRFTILNESERVIPSMVRAVRPFCPDMLRLQVGSRRSQILISSWNLLELPVNLMRLVMPEHVEGKNVEFASECRVVL